MPHIILKSTFLVFFVLLLTIASSQDVTAQPGSALKTGPLKLETIEKLVKAKADPVVIVAEIAAKGIDFFPSDDALARLRKLGATDRVIQVLRDKRQLVSPTTKRVRLVVAEFKAVGSTGKPITETLVEQLREAVRSYADVEILAPEITITAQQGSEFAKERAKQYGAQIIIWGWYSTQNDTVHVTVHFDVLEAPRNLALMNDKKTLPIPVASMEGFNVQIETPLSSEMSYLTLLTLAFARLEAEDFDGAIAAFTKTLSLPKAPDSMINPADVYFGRAVAHMAKSSLVFIDETELAIADLNEVLSLDPQHSPAYSQLCGIYGERGEIQKALSHCNKALAINADDYHALMQRGRAHAVSGDLDSASADFKALLKAASTDTEMDEVAKLVLSSLAHLFVQDTHTALIEVTKAANIARDNPEYPYILLLKTLMHWVDDDARGAIDTATEGLRRRPELVPFYLFRSFAYQMLENDSAAINDINSLLRARPTFARAYLERGEIYRRKDDPASAMRDYDRALELDPTLGEAYTGRARTYVLLKEYDKAIVDFDRALTAKKIDLSAYLYRGLAFVRKRDYIRAISDYDSYIRLLPSDEDGFSFRASVYELQGQFDKALADYDQAIVLNQNDADLFFARGELLKRKDQHVRAIADFDRVLKLNPSYTAAYESRGTTHLLVGNIDAAIRDYDKFIAVSPSNPVGYLRRAIARKAKGQLDQALLDYSRAIELRPDLSVSYEGRAEILYNKKEVDEAIADYSKALQLKPDAAVYRQRAFAYVDKSNWSGAIADFERARELDPTNRNSLPLGLSHQAVGELQKAISFFNEYITDKPADPKGYFFRGNAFKRSKDWQSALADYNKAIERQLSDDRVYYGRGYVLDQLGETDRALADYSEAIKRNSKSAEYFFLRYTLYFNKQDFSSAITDLDSAINLDPKNESYPYIRGLIHAAQKSYEASIRDFTLALRIKSDWDKALYERGRAYLASGDRLRGRADLLRCLKVTRDATIKEKAQSILSKTQGRTAAKR